MACRVFISHAEQDTDIAKALVAALVENFEIARQEIYCSFVQGCAPRIIGILADGLRSELESCHVFFVIFTPTSVGSSWVRMEVGAAWGLKKPLIPIAALGLANDEIPDALKGHWLISSEQADVKRAIISAFDDIGSSLSLALRVRSRNRSITTLVSRMRRTLNKRPGKFIDPRYRVGRFTANVYLGLLGGGDEVFDFDHLRFTYTDESVPLPEPIERNRERWTREQEEDARVNGYPFFNGPCIRLHTIDLNTPSVGGDERKTPILGFRPVCWYDDAISNKCIDDKVLVPGKGRVDIRSEYANKTMVERIVKERTVDWVQLSNILTVSVVLLTADEWTIIGERTKKVDNHSQMYMASAAENIHRWKDEPIDASEEGVTRWMLDEKDEGNKVGWDYSPRGCPNPFSTAQRGIKEEVGKEIAETLTNRDITFLAIAWDLRRFNPHLYALATTKLKIRELKQLMRGHRAEDGFEVTPIPVRFQPGGDLERYLADAKWAEISKGAILRALVHVHGFRKVSKAFN